MQKFVPVIAVVLTVLSLPLAGAVPLGSQHSAGVGTTTGAIDAPTIVSSSHDGPYDVELEIQQEANVTEGGDVNVTTWANNNANSTITNVTIDLIVDANQNGDFSDDSTVGTRTIDLSAGGYKPVEMAYNNVQLAPGQYEYQTRASKYGQTNTSFTNGTLTVEEGATTTFDVELELQQTANVSQGGDVNITTWANNNVDSPVSGVTIDLYVDADQDGQFSDDSTVTSRQVDLGASEYKPIELAYTNVQLGPGQYEYQSRASKDGQTYTSFTNGTLNVSTGAPGPGNAIDAIGNIDGTPGVGFQDILGAISAFNNNERIAGQSIGFHEILAAISEFNSA